ncbi:unnamed protein product [Spodoptera exigua]|nr:unnamed protein product [Spodoptera exigua]
MTIVDLSKTLISLMLEAQQRVERYGTSDVITVETINGWAELYQELVNCCDKVAVCFGYQTREYESTFKLLLLIIGYMIVVILPVVATQMASDQWAKCQRVMARLHNTMIDAVSNLLWRSTVVLEHFMLFFVVMTIVDLSKTLTSLMLEAQQRVERYGTSDVITVETINGWAELYQELVNCCDKVAVCFGYQTREYQSIIKLLLSIIGYMIVVILPVVATQMASDQWAKCQRVMARLHNTMIDGNTMADDGISLSTVVLEHFMLFFVVMTIVDLSKTLISLMLEAQQKVGRYGTSDVITVETINGWAELYQELVNCCDKVAVCFGYQYTFALSCSTVHYIILVYYVIYYNVYTTREYESTFKLLLLIIGYMIVVILPVVATQMASDQWAKCQRVMARLHNTMIDGNTMADDGISL